MDKGTLHFQESIDSLRDRFREIHVTLSARKSLPANQPAGWLFPQISGHTLQFVQSDFVDLEITRKRLNEYFGAVQVEADFMSLREISKALIKSSRDAATQLPDEEVTA